jgi:hypothetical protein
MMYRESLKSRKSFVTKQNFIMAWRKCGENKCADKNMEDERAVLIHHSHGFQFSSHACASSCLTSRASSKWRNRKGAGKPCFKRDTVTSALHTAFVMPVLTKGTGSVTHIGKPWRRPLGRPWCRWGENINMCPKVWRCGLDSFRSVHGPVAGSYEHGNELPGSIKDVEFHD